MNRNTLKLITVALVVVFVGLIWHLSNQSSESARNIDLAEVQQEAGSNTEALTLATVPELPPTEPPPQEGMARIRGSQIKATLNPSVQQFQPPTADEIAAITQADTSETQ